MVWKHWKASANFGGAAHNLLKARFELPSQTSRDLSCFELFRTFSKFHESHCDLLKLSSCSAWHGKICFSLLPSLDSKAFQMKKYKFLGGTWPIRFFIENNENVVDQTENMKTFSEVSEECCLLSFLYIFGYASLSSTVKGNAEASSKRKPVDGNYV